jgi:hypothetical protein
MGSKIEKIFHFSPWYNPPNLCCLKIFCLCVLWFKSNILELNISHFVFVALNKSKLWGNLFFVVVVQIVRMDLRYFQQTFYFMLDIDFIFWILDSNLVIFVSFFMFRFHSSTSKTKKLVIFASFFMFRFHISSSKIKKKNLTSKSKWVRNWN